MPARRSPPLSPAPATRVAAADVTPSRLGSDGAASCAQCPYPMRLMATAGTWRLPGRDWANNEEYGQELENEPAFSLGAVKSCVACCGSWPSWAEMRLARS